MSIIQNVNIKAQDSPSIDAFARFRVSNPVTIFDSKQIHDNQPLFWDDQEETGSGTTSTYSADAARTRLGVALNTTGKRTRQTFMRFNYQPGKSQMILMTTVLSSAGASGITGSIGLFDDNNGLFFQMDGTTLKAVIRSNVTGTPVDTKISQSNFNLDTMDGLGASQVNIDPSKTQILFIDYEWLGVGRVRFGFVIDGIPIYCHEFLNTNNLDVVYMSTPNLPLRYQIENDGTGAATTMDHICCSVITEGGHNETGILRNSSTNGTHIDANSANTVYAVIGIRLKSAHLDETIKLVGMSMISETNDDFEWIIYFNPTVAGTFTYSDITNSSVQEAKGVTANTITNGTPMLCGFSKSDSAIASVTQNALHLGSAIDGTPDEIVLAVRPLSANADIQAALNWRELS